MPWRTRRSDGVISLSYESWGWGLLLLATVTLVGLRAAEASPEEGPRLNHEKARELRTAKRGRGMVMLNPMMFRSSGAGLRFGRLIGKPSPWRKVSK